MSKKQIFISHTKKDIRFCDLVDKLFARVSLKAFRSEYEDIKHPEWKTIKDAMNNSTALFLLIRRELVKNQGLKISGWEHTQNWIAYEIGLACQLGIDVWAICDDVFINFPMPYINNYFPIKLKPMTKINFSLGLKTDIDLIYLKHIIESYDSNMKFPYPFSSLVSNSIYVKDVNCHYCGA